MIELECEACGAPLRTRLEADAPFFHHGSLVSDAFFLAYGGLHWSWSEVKALPLGVRRQFVETLERQPEFEREQMGAGGNELCASAFLGCRLKAVFRWTTHR